jgi:hypothetical protein
MPRVTVTVDLDVERDRVDVDVVAVWEPDDDGPALEAVLEGGEPVAVPAAGMRRIHAAIQDAWEEWRKDQRERWADERAEAIAEDRAFWRDRGHR